MRNKKVQGVLVILLILAAIAALGFFIGKPILNFLANPEQVRIWADGAGIWARVAFVGLMTLQMLFAFIPGEPLEISAGFVFGAVEGTLLCMAGAFIGTLIIFTLTRKYGLKLARRYFSLEKLQSMRFLQDSSRLNLLTFILFFIPGTPKDLMTYVLGATTMKLSTCLLITTFARIPSIVTSTIGGNALGTSNTTFAIIVFAVTAVISVIGLCVYRRISKRQPKETQAKTITGATDTPSTAA